MIARLLRAWKDTPFSALSFFMLAMALNVFAWVVILYVLYRILA